MSLHVKCGTSNKLRTRKSSEIRPGCVLGAVGNSRPPANLSRNNPPTGYYIRGNTNTKINTP